MSFKQKILNKINLSSFERIEEDIDKHTLIVFGLGVGIGVGTFLFGKKYLFNKKLKKKEESLLNDDSVDVKDYLKWKENHKSCHNYENSKLKPFVDRVADKYDSEDSASSYDDAD